MQLDALRDKQPPLPTAPIVKTSRQVSADGTLTINRVITGSALNKIGISSSSKFAPAIKQSRKGWPPEAIAAWASWGSKNPALFFRIWSELAPEGFNLGGGPTL